MESHWHLLQNHIKKKQKFNCERNPHCTRLPLHFHLQFFQHQLFLDCLLHLKYKLLITQTRVNCRSQAAHRSSHHMEHILHFPSAQDPHQFCVE